MASKRSKKKQIQLCKSGKIIESFHVNHYTLLCYLRKQCKAVRLIQDGDPVEYRALIKSTVVAVPRDQSATPPFKPTTTQWFTLKEIINRVIEHVCRANKTNVLAYGFESLNAYGKRGTVAGTVGIQNSYPNTIVSYLRTTRAWQVLHERIGDDLMIHLLQNVSMFVKVNSKCYFQVAGYPISRLSPLTATEGVSPQLHGKQKSVDDGGGENAVLKRKARRGGKRARRYFEKCAQKEEKGLSDVIGKDDEEHRMHVVSAQGSDRVANISSSPAVSETPAQMERSDCDLYIQYPVLTQSKRKRKIENSDDIQQQQPHAKKAKIVGECSEKKEIRAVMPVEKKDQTVLKRKKSVCSDSGMKKKEAKKQEVRRKPWDYLVKFLPESKQTASKMPSREVRGNSRPKKKKAQQPHNSRSRPTSKIKKSIRFNEVSLPRSSLFYASNLSETFPKNHVMETSPVSMAGARRLAQQIFLQERCLVTSRNSGGAVGSEKRDDKNVSAASTNHATPTPKKQKPFRLPKKLKRVQPLLLKFLARHKKCPFRTLLRHHCFYAQERVKKSKKTRTLQRIPLSVKMRYHKRSWKGGMKSSKRAPYKKKGVKVDALVYRHAVNNYTKHDQVSVQQGAYLLIFIFS